MNVTTIVLMTSAMTISRPEPLTPEQKRETSQLAAAKQQCRNLAEHCDFFRDKTGAWPTKIDDLCSLHPLGYKLLPDTAIVDPWGKKYEMGVIEVKGKKYVEVYTTAPDGKRVSSEDGKRR